MKRGTITCSFIVQSKKAGSSRVETHMNALGYPTLTECEENVALSESADPTHTVLNQTPYQINRST